MYQIAWRWKDRSDPKDVYFVPTRCELMSSCRRRLRQDFHIWAKDETLITDDKILGNNYIIHAQFEDAAAVYYIVEDMGMDVLVKERYRR